MNAMFFLAISILKPVLMLRNNFNVNTSTSPLVNSENTLVPSTKTSTVLKTVKVKVYISPKGREEFMKKGILVESLVESATDKLEDTLDTFLLDQANPVKIIFDPTFSSELPQGISLDNCDGIDIDSVADMLNEFNRQDSMTPSIIILSCKADPDLHMVNEESKNEAFKAVGQKVPYVNHSISSRCSTRTAIFLETEKPKFLSVFATALIRAAHVNILNPLIFEEVTNGDEGVRYEIRVSNDTVDQLKQDRCFYHSDSA